MLVELEVKSKNKIKSTGAELSSKSEDWSDGDPPCSSACSRSKLARTLPSTPSSRLNLTSAPPPPSQLAGGPLTSSGRSTPCWSHGSLAGKRGRGEEEESRRREVEEEKPRGQQ
ncbi:hypothetical protein Dimus_003170, partial [Dionaea muscipula]